LKNENIQDIFKRKLLFVECEIYNQKYSLFLESESICFFALLFQLLSLFYVSKKFRNRVL